MPRLSAAIAAYAACAIRVLAIDIAVSADGQVELSKEDIDRQDYQDFRAKHRKDQTEDALSYGERFQLYRERKAFVDKHNASRDFPRIKEVRAYVSKSDDKQHVQGADCHDVADRHWINGNLPCDGEMSVHPPYKRFRKSWGINAMGSMVVEVEADDGTCGVGVTIGGEPGCYIVEHHLSRFCEGQDPRNIELMWDQMFRATVNYGRKGLPIQALSAVDLALWDLLGKLRKEPVYMLLGGATKAFLPMYTTTSRPEVGKSLGFVGCKVPCPYGPADGQEGFAKNVKYLKQCREAVGEGFPLMLDCYMALSVPYSISLANRLAEQDLHFTWMEEFLPPDAYDGYEEVMKAVGNLGLMLTTGEHEYTRWGFKQLIDKKAAHILQPDITWLGGITEARRVMAMASASDVLVVPHGSSIYSYHLQFAFTNAPLGEFINLSVDGSQIQPYFGGLFDDEPLPKDGKITLDQVSKPGFGCALRKDNLRRPYVRPEGAVAANRERNRTLGDDTARPVMPLVSICGLSEKRGITWTAAVNVFADYSDAEFKALLGHRRLGKWWEASPMGSLQQASVVRREGQDLAASVDWRQNLVSTNYVKQQGACGSCWAVAAAGALEIHAEIAMKKEKKHSSQVPRNVSFKQLVDCTPNPEHCGGDGGCQGATSELAFEYASRHGLHDAKHYSGNINRGEDCKAASKKSPPYMQLHGYVRLETNKLKPLMEALANVGPVSVSVDAADWNMYGGGIFNDCKRDSIVNHAVLAVGYGHDPKSGLNYWLIRNSWGRDWGEQGFVRLQRHDGDDSDWDAGYCGFDTDRAGCGAFWG
ncbi:unnamed protein product [Effrenium voratum]|nr:unnamed protein product [Effrenium voratum]